MGIDQQPYLPGSRVEVVGELGSETLRPGVILYVGSDTNVLVGWDDQSTSVLPQERLTLSDKHVPNST